MLIRYQRWDDNRKDVSQEQSANPVIYLEFLGVRPLWRCMAAYSYLRGTDLFKDKDQVNIKHAETGLLVMSSTGLFLGALYDIFSDKGNGHWVWMFIIAIIFLGCSFPPSWVQHALECDKIRKEKGDVEGKLKDAGLLHESREQTE